MQTIGGYVVVAHRLCNGYHDDSVTHAFTDVRAAAKHVRARIAALDRKYADSVDDETTLLNEEKNPTLHAVSPRLFEKVKDHLSRGHDYESFAYRLGTAITEHVKPPLTRREYRHTYRVGGTEVFGTKGEAGGAVASRPAAGVKSTSGSPRP